MTRLTNSTKAGMVFLIACILACGCSRKSAESPKVAGDGKAGGSSQVANVGKHSEAENSAPTTPDAILAAVRPSIPSHPNTQRKEINGRYERGIIKLKRQVC